MEEKPAPPTERRKSLARRKSKVGPDPNEGEQGKDGGNTMEGEKSKKEPEDDMRTDKPMRRKSRNSRIGGDPNQPGAANQPDPNVSFAALPPAKPKAKGEKTKAFRSRFQSTPWVFTGRIGWKRVSTRQWIRDIRHTIARFQVYPYKRICGACFWSFGYYHDMIPELDMRRYAQTHPLHMKRVSVDTAKDLDAINAPEPTLMYDPADYPAAVEAATKRRASRRASRLASASKGKTNERNEHMKRTSSNVEGQIAELRRLASITEEKRKSLRDIRRKSQLAAGLVSEAKKAEKEEGEKSKNQALAGPSADAAKKGRKSQAGTELSTTDATPAGDKVRKPRASKAMSTKSGETAKNKDTKP